MEASSERERIALSLRWYEEATRDDGVDVLLKLWFALETLAMPDTTDIRPIRDGLASIYGTSPADAGQRYGISRIFGLRSRIVHEGLRIEVPPLLLAYIRAVYVDLLVAKLGFAPSNLAGTALDEAGGIDNLLPAVVGGRAEETQAKASEAFMERPRTAGKDAQTD